MQRTDPKLTKYQLLVERLQTEDDNKYDVIASMSTPGATWERKFDTNVTAWIKEDGKLFTISAGVPGVDFGKFEATYNNVTHSLNLTYSTARDVVFGYPVVLNGQFFNSTKDSLSRDLGIKLSASYRNYTIQQLSKLYYKPVGVIGFVNNITYWTGRYVFATGELNIPKKSISFMTNHTCSKTELTFNGTLGDEDNFLFTLNNGIANVGMDLTGRYLKTQREGVLRLFTRPLQQSFTLRGHYAESKDERGVRFIASHDNENRVLRWYSGIVQSPTEKALKTNATVLGSKAEAVLGYFNLGQSAGIKFNGLLLDKTINIVGSYVDVGEEKGIRLNTAAFDKTMEAALTYLNLPTGQSMKLNASVINKTIEAVWSYVNVGNEKGVRMNAVAMNYAAQSALVYQDFSDTSNIKLNASVLNKTIEAVWSYIYREKEKGIRLNVTAFKRTAVVMGSYFNQGKQRGIHLNASALNRTLATTWTIHNQANEKALKLHARALNKNIHATWSVLHSSAEKGLKFNTSLLNRTFNAKWTFVNLPSEKALNFQAWTLNKSINSTCSILHSVSEKSVKFNISALNKSLDAKVSYLNFTSEKGLKIQVRALNKTVDATWSFFSIGGERTLKFNASAFNNNFDAKWSLLDLPNGKKLIFDAQAVNKTMNASWSFLNLGKEKTLLFKANAMNKAINASWILVNLEEEKSLIFRASVLNKPVEIVWTILNHRSEKGLTLTAKSQSSAVRAAWLLANLKNEKSLIFRVDALDKRIESYLSYVSFPNEKGIKFNVTGLDKPFNAALTFASLTNEKLLKFNANGFNRHSEAFWSYVNTKNEDIIKINVSAMKKSAEAAVSYFKSNDERAIKFKATAMKKTLKAVWSYVMKKNERSIKFNASALNKNLDATLSYLVTENERSLKLKATVEKEAAEAVLSYQMSGQEKSIRFNATAMNQTIQATWMFVQNANEKSINFKAGCAKRFVEASLSYLWKESDRAIKFNASSMNKVVEAVWSYVQKENVRSVKFKGLAMKETVETALSYIVRENERSLQFTGSAMSKSVEANLVLLDNENGRSVKLSAFVMNETVEAIWSYRSTGNERSINFKALAAKKAMEATLTLLTSSSKKGLQFSLAVMNKSMNSSLVYFDEPTSSGVRLKVNCCNRSFLVESAMMFQEKKRSIVIKAAYQKRTIALIGQFETLEAQKSVCLYPEYLGRPRGRICAILTNSSSERSVSLDMEILNRTGQLKARLYNSQGEIATRFTAKFNRKTHLESWFSCSRSMEMKTLHFNATVNRKSVGASLFFRNTTEKAVGIKASVMKRHITVEGTLLTGKTTKEAAFLMYWNETVVSKLSVNLVNNEKRKMLQLRAHMGRFVAEWKTALAKQSEEVTEFFVVHMLRNGSQHLFFDSFKFTLSKEGRDHSFAYQHNIKLMGRSYEYGLFAEYDNNSNAEETYHETRLWFLYSKSKVFSLSGVYRNSSRKFYSALEVEYLPEKTLTHSLTWFKEDNSVKVNLELLPRKPITWITSWKTDDGIAMESSVNFLGKTINNWFTYIQSQGEYEGHFEICPVFPLSVKGFFMRENGLFFTSEVAALNTTWNHKIDFRKQQQKLLVSVDVLPNAPVAFDASWDTSKGMEIGMDMRAFKKSIYLASSYDRLTNTLQSGITVAKKTFTITKRLDVDTKTLSLALKAFNRTVGLSGRFDWKNFTANTFVSYENNQAGWFLAYDPAFRSIIFNITLTPTLSGQIVGDMPDNRHIRLAVQRKSGFSVVNEATGIYLLNGEGSRFSFTWNTTSMNMLTGSFQDLKALVTTAVLNYWNLTLERGENLTRELDIMVKKLQANIKPQILKLYENLTGDFDALVKNLDAKIRPQVLKLFEQVKKYDYQGLLDKAKVMTKNATLQFSLVALRALTDTVENLPEVVRNATILYKEMLGILAVLDKRVLRNFTDLYKKFQSEVIPLISGNATLHLKNITKDLEAWAKNVSLMLNGVKVKGRKLGEIIRNLYRKVKEITRELISKVDQKTRERIVKIREIQIRNQKIGPLFDEYKLKIQKFTCGFNASCTLKNVVSLARKLQESVQDYTVLNKTLLEHFKEFNETFYLHFMRLNSTVRQQLVELREKAFFVHQSAVNFTTNLKKIAPHLLENVTIQAIHLTRNMTMEARNIAVKVKIVILETYAKLMKLHGPLINLTTKAVILPVTKLAVELNSNVTRYLQSVVAPYAPVILDMFYRLQNVYIRNISVGLVMDRMFSISYEFARQAYHKLNQTLTTNIFAITTFISENSQKSPQEIIDLSKKKCIEFFSLTKKVLTSPLNLNLSDHAAVIFERSIATLNNTLQELLQLKPNEILDLYIKEIQVISRNITGEILKVIKQLRALDLTRPLKLALAKTDFVGRINALKVHMKWKNLVRSIQAFNLKERAVLLKYHLSNASVKIQKELQKLFALSQRILNLTENLIRTKISKDALMAECISIANEIGRISMKYGVLAQNTAIELEGRLRNILLKNGAVYKNITLVKTSEAYNFFKKHGQAFYDEHREEALAVYNAYKDLAETTYDALKGMAMAKFHIYQQRFTTQAKAFVAELTMYENMSYEEIAVKIYEFVNRYGLTLYNNVTLSATELYKKTTNQAMMMYKNITIHGLGFYENVASRGLELYKNVTLRAMKMYKNLSTRAMVIYNDIAKRGIELYKNVTLRGMEFFSDTQTVTLRAYNLTLMIIDQAKLVAFRYLNASRNTVINYYNIAWEFTLENYKLTRDLAVRCYQRYYNLSHNYTLYLCNLTRSMALQSLSKVRELSPRGELLLGYLNKALVPRIKDSLLNGKVVVLKYVNETVLLLRGALYRTKVWYLENKDKTVEKIIHESYELAERKSLEAKEILQLRFDELKELVQQKMEEMRSKCILVKAWTIQLQQLSKTLMEIREEVLSVYNQTANITYIAAGKLIAILEPCLKAVQNRTLVYLVSVKTNTLPLIDKAKAFISLKAVKTVETIVPLGREIMAREDVQQLIGKRHWQERRATAMKFVSEKYTETINFVEKIRPELEAHIQAAIDYINETLPALVKERFASIKIRCYALEKMCGGIIANPKDFVDTVLKMALGYLRNATRETPIEKYSYQETWVQLIEEMKGHRFVQLSRDFTNYTRDDLRRIARFVSDNVTRLVTIAKHQIESLKEGLRTKMQKTKVTLIERFEAVKEMKLHEIIEHNYVFNTIQLARNVTSKIQDITSQAAREILVVGELYYTNLTDQVQQYTLLLRAEFNNHTMMLKKMVQDNTIILKGALRLYARLLNEMVHNYTQILKAELQSYTNFVNTQIYAGFLYYEDYSKVVKVNTNLMKASIQSYKKILSAKVHNYTKMIKAQVDKYSLILKGHYERIYDTHFLPLYENGTILVQKYKALAEHCIGKCRNVTFGAIEYVRHWAVARVNETQVWLNQTIDSGMKVYNSELKPLYYGSLLPFYNNTLAVVYRIRNFGQQFIKLRENVTMQAVELRQRAINLTRQVVAMTANSHSYDTLRKLGKMTIRESLEEGRKIYLYAYNVTLGVSSMITNLTRLDFPKAYLQRALNDALSAFNQSLLEAEPVIAFLNATRIELIETAKFLSKYSGLEDAVEERVRRSIVVIKSTTTYFVNHQAPEFLKSSASKAQVLANRGIQYADVYFQRTMASLEAAFTNAAYRFDMIVKNVRLPMNKTIHHIIQSTKIAGNKALSIIQDARHSLYRSIKIIEDARVAFNKAINEGRSPIDTLRLALNETIARARASLDDLSLNVDKTMADFRAALSNYIQVTEGAITFVIPQSGSFVRNMSTIAIALADKVRSIPHLVFEKMMAYKPVLMQRFRALKRDTLVKIKNLEMTIMALRVQALDDMKSLKANISVKIKMLKDEAVSKMTSLKNEGLRKFRRAIEVFGDLKGKVIGLKDRLEAYGKVLIANGMNHSVIYRKKAVGLVIEAYNSIKNHPITSRYIYVTLSYMDTTKELVVVYSKDSYAIALNAYNLTKNHPLVKECLNLTIQYLNIVKEQLLDYRNKTLVLAKKYYVLAKNDPYFVKYSNMTLRYVTNTKNFVKGLDLTQTRNKTVELLKRGLRLSRQYMNITNLKSVTQRYLHRAFNLSRGREVLNEVKIITKKLVNLFRQLKAMVRNGTAKFLAFSRRCSFLKNPKKVTIDYLHRGLALSRYCRNITQRHLSQSVTLLRLWYRTGVNTTHGYYNKGYKVAEMVALDVLNSTSLEEAFGKVRNLSRNAYDITIELCGDVSQTAFRKARALYEKYSTMASNKTFSLYRDISMKTRNISHSVVRKTVRLYRHVYQRSMEIFKNTTLLKRYLPLMKVHVTTVFDASRNLTIYCYEVVTDVSRDVYNSSCLTEAFSKTKNYSKIALNAIKKLYLQAKIRAKIFTGRAFNQSVEWLRDFPSMALNRSIVLKRQALFKSRKFYSMALNKTIESCDRLYRNSLIYVYNTTFAKKYLPLARRAIEYCRRLFNETKATVHNSKLVQKYLPIAKRYAPVVYDTTRNFTLRSFMVVVGATIDIYNSSSFMEAYNKTSDYLSVTLNLTILKAEDCSIAALEITRHLYGEVVMKVNNYSALVIKNTLTLCQRVYNETAPLLYNSVVMKSYLPMALNFSRRCWTEGYGAVHDFTLGIYNSFFTAGLDIRDSSSLQQALMKFKSYCTNAVFKTMQFCRDLYYQIFDATVRSYNTLSMQSSALYNKIAEHETTVRCINGARTYIYNTKNMVKAQMKKMHRAKGHLHKRIGHEVNQMSRIMNPSNWIPPFNSKCTEPIDLTLSKSFIKKQFEALLSSFDTTLKWSQKLNYWCKGSRKRNKYRVHD